MRAQSWFFLQWMPLPCVVCYLPDDPLGLNVIEWEESPQGHRLSNRDPLVTAGWSKSSRGEGQGESGRALYLLIPRGGLALMWLCLGCPTLRQRTRLIPDDTHQVWAGCIVSDRSMLSENDGSQRGTQRGGGSRDVYCFRHLSSKRKWRIRCRKAQEPITVFITK